MDFTIIGRAGLRLTEFSKIAGVSRTTIYDQMNGTGTLNWLTKKRLEEVLAALTHWVSLGILPKKMTRQERPKFIDELRKAIDRPHAYE